MNNNERMTAAFKTIYKILVRLERSLDIPDDDENFDIDTQIGYKALNISEPRWKHYIEMLNEAEYISGAKINSYIDGTTDIDISEICITLKGLQYLAENTMMIRAYDTIRNIKDIVK